MSALNQNALIGQGPFDTILGGPSVLGGSAALTGPAGPQPLMWLDARNLWYLGHDSPVAHWPDAKTATPLQLQSIRTVAQQGERWDGQRIGGLRITVVTDDFTVPTADPAQDATLWAFAAGGDLGGGAHHLSLVLETDGTLRLRQNGAVPAADFHQLAWAGFRAVYAGSRLSVVVVFREGRSSQPPQIYVRGLNATASFVAGEGAGARPLWSPRELERAFFHSSLDFPVGRVPVSTWLIGALSEAEAVRRSAVPVLPFAYARKGDATRYLADWSAGVDGWGSNAALVNGNVDFADDSEENTLQVVASAEHGMELIRDQVFAPERRNIVSGWIRLGDADTNHRTDAILITAGAAEALVSTPIIHPANLDEWHYFEHVLDVPAGAHRIRILPVNTTAAVADRFVTSVADRFWLSDLRVSTEGLDHVSTYVRGSSSVASRFGDKVGTLGGGVVYGRADATQDHDDSRPVVYQHEAHSGLPDRLALPGADGNHVTRPAPLVKPTDEIDVRWSGSFDAFPPAGPVALVEAQGAFALHVLGDGAIRLTLVGGGDAMSSAPITPGAGDIVGVRATWRASDHRVQFWLSHSLEGWAQVGIDREIVALGVVQEWTALDVCGQNERLTGTVTGASLSSRLNRPGECRFVPDGRAEPADTVVADAIDGVDWLVRKSHAHVGGGRDALTYWETPGSAGDFARVLNDPLLYVQRDIEIVAHVTLTSNPGPPRTILGRWSEANDPDLRNYRLHIDGQDRLRLTTACASGYVSSVSSVGLPYIPGTDIWVRATMVKDALADTATFNYSWSHDGVVWVPLGETDRVNDNAGAGGDNCDGDQDVNVGWSHSGTANPFVGRIHYISVARGAGAAPFLEFLPPRPGVTEWHDAVSGLGWTVGQSSYRAAHFAEAEGDHSIHFGQAGNFWSAPAYDPPANSAVIFEVHFDPHALAFTIDRALMGQWPAPELQSGTGRGWKLDLVSPTMRPRFEFSTDGTLGAVISLACSAACPTRYLRLAIDWASGQARWHYSLDRTNWSQLGEPHAFTPGAFPFAGHGQELNFGAVNAGLSSPFDGRLYFARIYQAPLFGSARRQLNVAGRSANATGYDDALGNAYTLHRAGNRPTAIVKRSGVAGNGTAHWMQLAAAMQNLSAPLTVIAAYRAWDAPSSIIGGASANVLGRIMDRFEAGTTLSAAGHDEDRVIVAAVIDGADSAIYRQGVELARGAVDTEDPVYLLRAFGDYANAQVEEVLVFARALTPEETLAASIEIQGRAARSA